MTALLRAGIALGRAKLALALWRAEITAVYATLTRASCST